MAVLCHAGRPTLVKGRVEKDDGDLEGDLDGALDGDLGGTRHAPNKPGAGPDNSGWCSVFPSYGQQSFHRVST